MCGNAAACLIDIVLLLILLLAIASSRRSLPNGVPAAPSFDSVNACGVFAYPEVFTGKFMNPHPPSTLEPGRPADPTTNPAKPDVSGPDRPGSPRRIWLWVLLLVLLGVGAYYFFSRSKQQPGSTPVAQGTARAGRGGGRRGTGVPPVVAVKATKGDIGVYFTGLGAVTPIYTVSVKSRVDGQLMTVYYREGQIVHQGDSLAEIDTRPYQVQLSQAEGQLVRDQALLDNARIDLTRYQQLIGRRAVPNKPWPRKKRLLRKMKGRYGPIRPRSTAPN